MEERRFEKYMLEEGEFLDAMKVGVKAGFKAFRRKREAQAKTDEKRAMDRKMLDAEGAELNNLIQQIVEKGYTIRNGKVVKPSPKQVLSNWLYECISTKMASRLES